MPRARSLDALTGLRFFPALAVLVFHFGRGPIPPEHPLRSLLEAGFLGVDMFFVLSGFVLVHAYRDEAFAQPGSRIAFYRARAARIVPLYLVSLALGFAVDPAYAIRTIAGPLGWLKLGMVMTLTNAWAHQGMFFLNWAAWSLSVEAFFYVLFPFLAPRLAALGTRALWGVIALAYVVGFVAPTVYMTVNPDHLAPPIYKPDQELWSWYLKFFPLCHLHEFVLGAAVGALFVRHEAAFDRFVSRRPDLLAFAAFAPIVLAAAASRHIPYPWLHGALLPPVFAALIAVLACGRGRLARLFATRPLGLLGRASYGMYILQVPVVYLSRNWWGAATSLPATAALVAGMTALSIVAHLAIEEPLRRAFAPAKRRLISEPSSLPSSG